MSFLSCDTTGGNVATWTDLRIAPVFTIWLTGTLSAAFPILAYRSSVTRVRIPRTLFEYAFPAWYHFLSLTNWHRFAKYLGSGVIIATAFIHLLRPAISELTSPCLGAAWNTHVRTLLNCLFHPDSDLLPQCSLIRCCLLS
jgi:solute carrier family 39 (zinc transporter), member 1/2/3